MIGDISGSCTKKRGLSIFALSGLLGAESGEEMLNAEG
jgi:hypothetical protein